MPRRKLIDIRQIDLLRQEVAAARADDIRKWDAIDQRLVALLPPEDDREARRIRGKKAYRNFLAT